MNLFASHTAVLERERRWFRVWMWILIVAAATAAVAATLCRTTAPLLEKRIVALRAQDAVFHSGAVAVRQMRRDRTELTIRLAAQRTAGVPGQQWRRILQALSESIPDDVWLAAVRSEPSGAPERLVLRGGAVTPQAVADCIDKWRAQKLLGAVRLVFMREKKAGDQRITEFEVSVPFSADVRARLVSQ